jgi:1-phosphatidylinositol-4-phosphate 5-kinase
VPGFAATTLSLYYFWHFSFWIFSVCVLIGAFWILRGHLAASSETRKFVLKQNFIYVLVLGIETFLIVPIWVTQLSLTKRRIASLRPNYRNYNTYYPYYHTYTDLGLAIAFAIIHSLRGTIDFFVWLGTFTVGYADFKHLRHRLRHKLSKPHEDWIIQDFHSPFVKQDSAVNRALRKNAMYCINIGILDAVTPDMEQQQTTVERTGLEDNSYINASLIESEGNQQPNETTERYRNPKHREQNLRNICFPAASSLLGITSFSFIDLEPSVFSLLRSCYGIATLDYRASFRIRNAADIESSGMLEKFTEGKSGSFFYFTRDFKYIIKTVTDEEEKFLQRIAYQYYDHMKNNPNSLIVRFLGLHKVRLAKEQRFITVVVMENIFYNTEQFKMHERYDLKGSKVGRRSVKKTSKIRREYKGTLKDLDLGDKKIHVGADSKTRLVEQLRRDIEFLVRCKIMDYSMLLGIHNHSADEKIDREKLRSASLECEGQHTEIDHDMIPLKDLHSSDSRPTDSTASSGYGTRTNTIDTDLDDGESPVKLTSAARQKQIAWFRADFGGHRNTSGLHPLSLLNGGPQAPETSIGDRASTTDVAPATYYFGIVDILQQFNLRKKAEHHWKTKVACQDKHGISCVNEREYGERFLNFMDEIFD